MTLATFITGSDLSDGDTSGDTTGDTNLAGRFAAGEDDAFEQIVELYQPRVARLARRLLAWDGDVDDIVQDVFLAALTSAKRFRQDASLWTWLSTITVNRCRTRARRTGLGRRVREWFSRSIEPTAPAADVEAMADERGRVVRQAINALPVLEREAVVLFYLEGRSREDLSRILSATPNTISVRLHRARQRLADSLAPLVKEAET